MTKKLTAALLAFCMCAFMTSCADQKKNSDDTSVTDKTETSASESAAEETEAETEAKSGPEVSYDFDGLDSEKAVKTLTSSKYHIKFKSVVEMGEGSEDTELHQDIYFSEGAVLVDNDFMDTNYSMLYKDGEQYTILGDIYSKTSSGSSDEVEELDMFKGFGYVESGTMDFEGQNYKYDEYYQVTTGAYFKFLVDDKKELKAIISDKNTMYIETLEDSFDDSAVSVPSGAKEVTQEEFNTVFVQKLLAQSETSGS